jgi:hypothetical protein
VSSLPTSSLTPSPTPPYFHAVPLQEQFAQDVTRAAAEGLIDYSEKEWLLSLLDSRTPEQSVNPPRLDWLIKTGGLPTDLEFAATMMISQTASGDGTVYLSSLLYGLERFDSRERLAAVLTERFGSLTDEVPTFEDELVEGPVFEQQSRRIIAQQTDKVAERAERLQHLPTLQAVLGHALQLQINTALAGSTVDPFSHLLQIVQPMVQPPDNDVSGVQTLVDALLDEYTGQRLPVGLSRRFLDETGKAVSEAESQQWQAAFTDAAFSTPGVFETLLGNYWWSPVGHGQTRRAYFADALAETFRRELFTCRRESALDGQDFLRISALLDPASARWSEVGQVQLSKLMLTLDKHPSSSLAGVFLMEKVVPHLQEVWLYTPGDGLRQFHNRQAVRGYFNLPGGSAQLLRYLPLEDQALLPCAVNVSLSFVDITAPLFLDRMDSIIALQNRNLAFALAQPRRGREQTPVMIDDALDIRHLIDARLLRLTGSGRWCEQAVDFQATWSTPIEVQPAEPTEVLEPSWLDLAMRYDSDACRVWQAHPDIAACARDLLNTEMAVLGEGLLDAYDVRLAWDQGPLERGLIAFFLERVTGHRVIDLPFDTRITLAPDAAPAKPSVLFLTPALINELVQRAAPKLASALAAQSRRFASRPQRELDSQIHPGARLCGIRSGLLHIELAMDNRVNQLDSDTSVMFEQVLNFPVRALRRAFAANAVEVYALSLGDGTPLPAVALSNVFVLQQPLHPTHSNRVAFWSPFLGAWEFDSWTELKQQLIIRLRWPETLESWLKLIPDQEKQRVQRALLRPDSQGLSLLETRLDGHLFEQLQRVEEDRQRQGVESALAFAQRCRVEATLFNNLMTAAQIDDRLGDGLEILISSLQSTVFEAQLPDWMRQAERHDLQQYADILMRYYVTNDPDHDFLFGVPFLKDFAREQLQRQLRIDFPNRSFDPDALTITLTRYVGAPVGTGQTPGFLPAVTEVVSETLTEYSLNHFSTIQGATLAVVATEDPSTALALTPAYLRQLIHTVDVGTRFQALLTEKLDSTSADFPLRQQYFTQQWPTLMLERGFQQKLAKKLSARAFDYIQSLMEMPDDLARQSVDEEDIVLSTLDLIAKPGAAADRIPGFYVIGPKDVTHGPVILHAIFNQGFCFKEYADRAALLQDLRTSSALQSQIMHRATPQVQARYGHHSFLLPPVWTTEFYTDFPMFPLGPVNLADAPVQGNVLQYLLQDAVAVLKNLAKNQTVTSAQSDWESFTYLSTLAVEQVAMFLPGEVGVLVAGWQGLSLVQASVSAATRRKWGQALSEFTAALAVFVTAKSSGEEDAAFEEEESEQVEAFATEAPEPLLPRFSWRNAQVPLDVKIRLQAFEVSDIALSNLLRDELFNLYQDPATEKQYAAVAGKVYQVREQEDVWRIVNAEGTGPQIKLNDHQQWEVDLQWGLRGGGGQQTRLRGGQASASSRAIKDVDAEVSKVFGVLASGMPAIRKFNMNHARRIGEGHLRAKRYVETCLDNLNVQLPGAALDPRTTHIISEFFGIAAPSSALVQRITQSSIQLFHAVMDSSLSPWNSPRFVVGLNRYGHESTVAFTAKTDPLQRIYLSERFFTVPKYRLRAPQPGSPPFNVEAHYRGATLLHELSHLSNDTFDMAYVEANAPFLDLLADHTLPLAMIKADMREIQLNYFSHGTDPGKLFKHFNEGQWQDLGDGDAQGRQFVLGVTGTATLDEARPVFLTDADKRSEIILRNADSLTLLVMKLGRERFMP